MAESIPQLLHAVAYLKLYYARLKWSHFDSALRSHLIRSDKSSHQYSVLVVLTYTSARQRNTRHVCEESRRLDSN